MINSTYCLLSVLTLFTSATNAFGRDPAARAYQYQGARGAQGRWIESVLKRALGKEIQQIKTNVQKHFPSLDRASRSFLLSTLFDAKYTNSTSTFCFAFVTQSGKGFHEHMGMLNVGSNIVLRVSHVELPKASQSVVTVTHITVGGRKAVVSYRTFVFDGKAWKEVKYVRKPCACVACDPKLSNHDEPKQ